MIQDQQQRMHDHDACKPVLPDVNNVLMLEAEQYPYLPQSSLKHYGHIINRKTDLKR
jgi:hypothetical protein